MKLMKTRFFVVLALSLFSAPLPVRGIELYYQFKTGDRYRVVSTVTEDVYVDQRLSYKAEILSRISMEITGVTGGLARYSAVFQSAEKTVAAASGARTGEGQPFRWSRDYQSEFDQDRLGRMTVGDQYYMPQVRNLPVFPGRDLNPGDTWTADGLEVHDFRDNYRIDRPYRIPFTARYTFLGGREYKGRVYPAFSVSYRIFAEPDPVPGKIFPRRILGASDQVVYWDTEHCQAAAYTEHFRTVFDLSDGQTWEYRGRAEAEVVEAPVMNKEEMAREIADEIGDIPDASVRVSDEGIVINLENIQFAPDSAALSPGEWPKLDKIAGILLKYPDRDILVGGHTALAGTAAMRDRLSEERASAVADYLLSKKVRTPDRMVVRGYGAERPMGDNNTETGRQKNRRVEITILEN
ncbi:MAG: OmpA family protein [Treponema sp.]|jgi:outer membrane protein OmpA-like peptidoglycan-associated protein|nr:OmpA family protein [Treponema sp.]